MTAANLLVIIAVTIGVIVFVAYTVILSTPLYERMPYLFDKKQYKVWKECYNDDIVSSKEITYNQGDHIGIHKEYYFANGKYNAVVFYTDGKYNGCDIFENETLKSVFSCFWKKHSDLMAEKVKDYPITEKIDLMDFK